MMTGKAIAIKKKIVIMREEDNDEDEEVDYDDDPNLPTKYFLMILTCPPC